MRVGDDLAGDAPTGRPHDRLIGIRHDDSILAPKPDARPPIPDQFHAPILTQPAAPITRITRRRIADCVRRAWVAGARRPRAPSERTSTSVSEERSSQRSDGRPGATAESWHKERARRLPNRRPARREGGWNPRGFGPNRTLDGPRSRTASHPIKKATLTKLVPPGPRPAREPHATIPPMTSPRLPLVGSTSAPARRRIRRLPAAQSALVAVLCSRSWPRCGVFGPAALASPARQPARRRRPIRRPSTRRSRNRCARSAASRRRRRSSRRSSTRPP